MTDTENKLPPIIEKRLAEIGEYTTEERERMKEVEDLDSLLRDYYKGFVSGRGLWEKLSELEKQGKQFLLREAHAKLKGSFKWEGLPIVFDEADDGTLSVVFRENE